ncbi:hypothetical protein G6011_05284 [Alternaria panax]|uniref:Major facilitator superfamily (MFS) profile domain-containing protein n=1 Tax=Alternaria panax TaxID=48097 RepID=A0AAD4FEJ6_9PLEO|nr:hypothetical protein G6011_05284 [Alternaria panax]
MSFFLPDTPRWLANNGFMQEGLQTVADLHLSGDTDAPHPVEWWVTFSVSDIPHFDRWGRKPLLILGGVLMAALLGIVCAFTEASMLIMTRTNGHRNKGMALATTSNCIFNFIIGMVSADTFAGIGGYFYLVIAGFCLLSASLAHFYYVERANHSLEEIAMAFGDKAFADGNEEIMDTVKAEDEKIHNKV